MVRSPTRLRTRIRDEYRFVHRRVGWLYVPGVLAYCTLCSLMIVYLAFILGPSAAWFAAGFGTGASLLFLWLLINTDEATRLESAALAEEHVSAELRKLKRDGWRSFDNLEFAASDVDHVVIGPGGVVVLETKWSAGRWNGRLGGPRSVAIRKAEEQLARNRQRVDAVLKQFGSDAQSIGAAIVACGPSRPDGPIRTDNGVRVIPVDEIRAFIAGLPATADVDQVGTAVSAIERYAIGRAASAT